MSSPCSDEMADGNSSNQTPLAHGSMIETPEHHVDDRASNSKESSENGSKDGRGHRSQSASSSSRLAPVSNKRSRRNSVQMACERCRRRKIRCSGLPGPCAACTRLKVACHDPGKRKDRAQSLLEDRIQRLEALALSNQTFNMQVDEVSPHQLPMLQTQNLGGFPTTTTEDFHAASPFSTQSWDHWSVPISPACYSDQAPDVKGSWPPSEHFPQPPFESHVRSSAPLHRRSHTFPVVENQETWVAPDEYAPVSAGAFSDIPSIAITTHNFSRPHSPAIPPESSLSPPGFSIPYRSALADPDEIPEEPAHEMPKTPPLFAYRQRSTSESPIEYYGEHLSPLDQPPPFPLRRTSSTTADGRFPPTFDIGPTQIAVPPSISSYFGQARPNRSQTMPSTLADIGSEFSQDITILINSPNTRNYAQVFFSKVHPEYPFLDPTTFIKNRSLAYRRSGLPSDAAHHRTDIPEAVSAYQILLVAAIGALFHHNSRSTASRLLQKAETLRSQFDMWSSVSSVHCAILLSIYCYLEHAMSFSDEDEKQQHDSRSIDAFQKPHLLGVSQPNRHSINLWMHNCQVAAACIDLGMHEGFPSDDDNMWDDSVGSNISSTSGVGTQTSYPGNRRLEMLCRNTFRTAYKLDKQISNLRRRPRAFHDPDIDPGLIAGL